MKRIFAFFGFLCLLISFALIGCDSNPTTLTTPTGVTVNETGLVTWTAVSNASSYVVNVNGTDVSSKVTDTKYQITETAEGVYKIKVKAIGDGDKFVDSAYSAEVSYTIAQQQPQLAILSAPKNVAISETGLLTWDAVSGAVGYKIYANGICLTGINVTDTQFQVEIVAIGEYQISVKAIGDGTTNSDSELSASVTYEIKEIYGTEEHPYEISTIADLEKLSLYPGSHFVLTADIDMANVEWTPLEAFEGVLDGKGYKIKNLTSIGSSEFVGGFCTYNRGTIKNLGFENVSVSNNTQTGDFKYAGGICTQNIGKIENCFVTGEVYSYGIAAGLATENFGTIKDSFVVANITGETIHAVGLVFNNFTSELSNSFYYGVLDGGILEYGVVIDVTNDEASKVSGNYCQDLYIPVFNGAFAAGATALTKEQLLSGDATLFASLDENNWNFVAGSLPLQKAFSSLSINLEDYEEKIDVTELGTALNPYLVDSADDLLLMAENLDKHFKMTADVDMTGVAWPSFNWSGNFDGDGHKISNLTVTGDYDFVGGFVSFNHGTIKNVVFENISVTSTQAAGFRYAGGVASVNAATGIIDNVKVSGNITSVGPAASIACENFYLINACESTASVVSTEVHACGLVFNTFNATITNSKFDGTLSAPILMYGIVIDANGATMSGNSTVSLYPGVFAAGYEGTFTTFERAE